VSKDIEQELDVILARHQARVTQSRSETAEKSAAANDFAQAAAVCLASTIRPVLEEMAQALNARGVAARVPADGTDVRIDIPVSRLARLGYGFGGYPYLRAKPDRETQRILFERNTSDAHGGNVIGDYSIAEIDAALVKSMVMDLVRRLYGSG